jgi:hypothetical protein
MWPFKKPQPLTKYPTREELGQLVFIGRAKRNFLGLGERSVLNQYGLYVQVRAGGGWERVQAGEKHKSHLDVYIKEYGRLDFKKFQRGPWLDGLAETYELAREIVASRTRLGEFDQDLGKRLPLDSAGRSQYRPSRPFTRSGAGSRRRGRRPAVAVDY